MIRKRIILVALSVLCTYALNAQLTTDKVLFEKLDLDYPGLETVRADVSAGDLEAAKHDFAQYLRTRTNIRWVFDWKKGFTESVRNAF